MFVFVVFIVVVVVFVCGGDGEVYLSSVIVVMIVGMCLFVGMWVLCGMCWVDY